MSRTRVTLATLVLLGITASSAAWYWVQHRASVVDPNVSWTRAMYYFHLRPITEDQRAAGSAREVWQTLFPAMAADPDTRRLLQELTGPRDAARR